MKRLANCGHRLLSLMYRTFRRLTDLQIGVVGYCEPTKFDKDEAGRMVREAFDELARRHRWRRITVVSGLTNTGVLAIAYKEAAARGWRTVGIACSRADGYDCFPVDERYIFGHRWGHESPWFLRRIRRGWLVRVGGGEQALRETKEHKAAGGRALEYELPRLG
ncbi:MAG TPA: hypothetical protein VLI05_06945 [Candidatus Saccharimonadia bacterium]|nr:hypothetical protein [Candidatus Saccharimonadia bacterium]